MTIVSRLVLREILFPFLLSFVGLSLLLLLGRFFQVLEPVLRAGVGTGEIITLMFLSLPPLWVYVIPMACLLGVVLGFLRLSRDCEIVALFASGIGPSVMLRSVFGFALAVAMACLVLSVFILPYTKSVAKGYLRHLTGAVLARGLPERTFITPVKDFTLYVHKTGEDGRRLEGVYLRDARRDDTTVTGMAETGRFLFDPASAQMGVRLENGTMNRFDHDLTRSDTISFRSYSLRFDAGGGKRAKRRGEMGTGELVSKSLDPSLPAKERNLLKGELHKRLSMPVGTLILGLVAAPLGIFYGRAGLSGGVFIGLFAFLVYYLLFAFFSNLADTGAMSPEVALWIPNVLFLFAAVLAVVILERKGPLRA